MLFFHFSPHPRDWLSLRATRPNAARKMEDESRLDQITLSTLSLLESRLQRLEHLVCGREPAPFRGHGDSALQRLQRLERRFSSLTSGHRVYGELLNICTSALLHLLLKRSRGPPSYPAELTTAQ